MNTKLTLAILLLFGLSLGTWAALGRGGSRDPKSGERSTAHEAGPVPAPEFTGVTDWINSKALRLADQKGKVVVVHFWTNGCINCIHNYPHYRAWQDRYKDEKNLLLIGVHTPEFDAEKDLGRIKDRMARNKLTFAVAVDNGGATWKAWGNRYWPAIYLVDRKGTIRYRWEGELGADGFKQVTRKIDELLAEKQAR